jgi:hypothetical protein
MRGAIVFLIAFAIFLLVTIAYPGMPPAQQIYSAFNLPLTGYLVGGAIEASTLILAVFNGVIYGVIIWLVYTFAEKAMKSKSKQETQAKQAQA